MYKGERTPEAVLAAAGAESGGSAVRYGVSAWHLVNGRSREAAALWASILEGPDWPSFGYLAAEAEVARARELVTRFMPGSSSHERALHRRR